MTYRFDGTEYDFLSNFHPSPISLYGKTYPTVEHPTPHTVQYVRTTLTRGTISPAYRAGRDPG
ncbi:MAG: hypothetical protein FJ034_01580 [Chloroflexi bacterium]|nr:hypothetical protein [Chloroflexota bacterium]